VRDQLERIRPTRIGIIGSTSYQWIVLDVAAQLTQVELFALPESDPAATNVERALQYDIQLLFVEDRFGEGVVESARRVSNDAELHSPRSTSYATVSFTSGTFGPRKPVRIGFTTVFRLSRRGLIARVLSRQPVLLVWMSLSHFVQRLLILRCLATGGRTIISDFKSLPLALARHRPTHMTAAPYVYDSFAAWAATYLRSLGKFRRSMHACYLALRINRLSWAHPVRLLFDLLFFPEVRRRFGGRVEEFRFGGSGAKIESLRTLDKVGIQVLGSYGTSELGGISSDTPQTARLGSVGKPSRPVKISSAGEILVKDGPETRDKANLTTDEQGYIATGDRGEMLDGYLWVHGRLDSVLVLDNAKKIYPNELEKILEDLIHPCIAYVLTLDRIRLSAVVITELDDAELLRDALTKYNASVANHACLNEVLLLPAWRARDFLNSNFKPNRRIFPTLFRQLREAGTLISCRPPAREGYERTRYSTHGALPTRGEIGATQGDLPRRP
jgi:long-chain acyl-CoA synthetase